MEIVTKWQRVIWENDDLDVHELITLRGVGKTTFGIEWVKDADTSIVISAHHARARLARGEVDKDKDNVKVITNLQQLRGIKVRGSVRIFVDDYFEQPKITLDELDNVIGHTNYKVLFAGTRMKDEDKFKIPFSKQYTVNMDALIADYGFYESLIQKYIVLGIDNPFIEIN